MQIGYQRGGLYSYDWLDDRPSAIRILPELQHLVVGDVIPLGQGTGWPVAIIEPNRALVLDMRNAVAGLLTVVILSSVQLIGVLTANAAMTDVGTIGWRLMAFPIVPAAIFGLFFTHGTRNGGIVPGAVDNLSACGVAVALCKVLVANPSLIPADTEVRFISFGGEEAGLRGSRRYVARHLDDLRRLDARDLNMEMIAHPEIAILTSEKSGTVRNSPVMVQSVVAAAERAGVPYKLNAAVVGEANDAGSFSVAGLKATTLIPFKMPQQLVAFYHQKWDRPDVLTIEPLLNVLKVALEWVRHGGS